MTCEYCGSEKSNHLEIQRVGYDLCSACVNNVPMKEINKRSHLRAVAEGDIDSDNCSDCQEHARDLHERHQDSLIKEL